MVNWKLKTFWFWSLEEHLFGICKAKNICISNIENWVGVRNEEISCNTLYNVVHQIGYYYVSIFHSEIKLKASLESYFLFSVFCPQKSLKLDPTRSTGLFTASWRGRAKCLFVVVWPVNERQNSRDSPDLKSQTTE